MNPYHLLVILSFLVILSYLFTIFSRISRIPSVLLLILTGFGLRYLTLLWSPKQETIGLLTNLLGTIGLIMIILEAALDLELSREKIPVIRRSLLSSMVLLVLSAGSISYLFSHWLEAPLVTCLLYAIPLSVISSAIVVSSAEHLTGEKKEFAVYESSMSDILGIMAFNYFAFNHSGNGNTILPFALDLLLLVVLSTAACYGLLLLLDKARTAVRIFLIFAILLLLYSLGKIFHYSSLLLILLFGLVLNNFRLIPARILWRGFDHSRMLGTVEQVKGLTAETSFLVRTFFFLLFGFSIDPQRLASQTVVEVGLVVFVILVFLRVLFLKFGLRTSFLPEVFLMPRGLVTIILLFSIPEEFRSPLFEEGVTILVIVLSNIFMTIGLLFHRDEAERTVSGESG